MSNSLSNIPLSKLPLATESISHVPTKNAMGEEYKHSIEPELAGASIPRLARLTPGTLTTRRYLWNAAFVALGLIVFLGQRDIALWDNIIKSGVTVSAVVYEGAERSENNSASIKFEADAGTVTSERPVSHTESVSFQVGQSFLLTYLPGTQGEVWLEGQPDSQQRNERLLLWGLAGLGTFGLFAATIAYCEKRWQHQLHLLQEGVAVHGLVRSGEVIEITNPPRYHIRYTYWVGRGKEKGRVRVSEYEYRSLTTRNPYFTVLYDVTQPSVSKPYFQCNAAYLVAK